MNNVPYDFADKVLTQMDDDIYRVRFASPLWDEAARVHRKKRREFHFYLSITEQGLKYVIKHSGHPWARVTLTEFKQLDHRFDQISTISLRPYNETDETMNEIRINDQPEFVALLSSFRLERVVIRRDEVFEDRQQQLLDLFSKCDLQTQCLDICCSPGTENFMKIQLASMANSAHPQRQFTGYELSSLYQEMLSWRATEHGWKRLNLWSDSIGTYWLDVELFGGNYVLNCDYEDRYEAKKLSQRRIVSWRVRNRHRFEPNLVILTLFVLPIVAYYLRFLKYLY